MSAASIVTTHIDHHRITRHRTFAVSGRDITLDVIASILAMLRDEHATGRVCIDLSQGAPGTIQFEETAKIA
jgi:hypothetical protein